MRSRKYLIAAAAVIALVATACRPDSSVMADQRSVPEAYVRFSGIDSQYGGSIGLDLMMGDYNPCHQQFDDQGAFNDSFYAACQDSWAGPTSYFRHTTFGANDTTAGARLVWQNLSVNFCNGAPWCPAQPPVMQTMWANKVTNWALEIYPNNAAEGGVRLDGGLPAMWGNDAVSPDLGTIRLPQAGQPGTTSLSGVITTGAGFQEYTIAAFQRAPFTLTTTTGYPEQGFAAVENSGGSYATPKLPTGNYTIVVWNNVNGLAYGVDRYLGGGDRLDLNPAQPCFGLGVAYYPFSTTRAC
jgi:hypothetical protein